MRLLSIVAAPGASVACDMTTATDTPEQRLQEYRRLVATALIAWDRMDDGYTFCFDATPDTRRWVTDLAVREAACCPFLSMRIDQHEDEIVWTLSSAGWPAAQAFLDDFCVALSTP